MNGPQRTAVSRKELWQKQKQKKHICFENTPRRSPTPWHRDAATPGHRTDNVQILFSPGCEQPLRDNDLGDNPNNWPLSFTTPKDHL